jgi:hypothetical protein
MKVVMEGGKFKTETEVFRAFRMANFGAQGLSDGKVQGVFQRMIVEMVARGKAAVVIEYLRRQADLLEAEPERMTAPRKKSRPSGRYFVGAPQNNMWDKHTPKNRPKVMASDNAVEHGMAIEEHEFIEEDEAPGTRRDKRHDEQVFADTQSEGAEKNAQIASDASLPEDDGGAD